MSEDLEARGERYRPLVQREMRTVVGDAPEPLYAWMRYHLGWENREGRPVTASPGKMLRPLALLLATELCGGRVEQAVPAAAAVELIHNFSLLHDDVEDRSDTRRGRETVWTFAGAAHAINAGDGMFTLAHLAMDRLAAAGVDAAPRFQWRAGRVPRARWPPRTNCTRPACASSRASTSTSRSRSART